MKKAGLVFIPSPRRGHIGSTVEFAKRLLDRDDRFSVTVLVMKQPFGSTVDAYTQSLPASDTRIRYVDLPQADPPSPELHKHSVEKYVSAFIENHKPHVKDAITNLLVSSDSNSSSVKLAGLVLDFFCTAMIDAANELGVPSYLFFTSSAAFLGLMLHLPTRHDRIGTEFNESDPESIIPSYANPVPASVLPSGMLNKEGGYASFLDHARKFKGTKGIIVNTFAELESYAVNSLLADQNQMKTPRIYTVGPVLDLKAAVKGTENDQWRQYSRTEYDKIMKWLDDQPESSVVFLCFGSRGSFCAPQVKETALGLELSGQRFLWSIRQPPSNDDKFAVPSGDYTNHQEILPHGFLQRTERRGMICGWAPQVDVLAHPATGGFVSHCGWNSILESLWFGVPIVTWPIYAEQQINAFEMVRELGLAVELKMDCRNVGDLVMADQIERAVRCVMEGDTPLRERVKEMGEKCRKAVMSGGSSLASFERLIMDMTSMESTNEELTN